MADRKQTFYLNRRNFLRFGGLAAVAAATASCATSETTNTASDTANPFTELVDQLPRPSYVPSMERQTVSVQEILPITYPETAEAAANQLMVDLVLFRDILDGNRNNPDINPRLGPLFWQQTAGGFDFLDENTLLEVVTNACNDLQSGQLEIVPLADPTHAFMENVQTTKAGDGTAFASTSTIRIPETSVAFNDRYGNTVRTSNIQFLITGLYEYAARMSTVGIIAGLNDRWYSQDNPAQTDDQVRNDVHLYFEALYAKGYRLSTSQNLVLFAAARSLAALAGDANGRVEGLEFIENFGIYPNYVAALNGDNEALVQLQYDLSVGAGY